MMPALFSSAFKDFSKMIRSGSWARRVLFLTGLMLIASGCFHMVVFVAERGSWEGPLSWRKPILFGFSGGVTILSVGWVVSLVAEGKLYADWIRRIEPWFCLSVALAMVTEVALITLQTWRGEASHFNESTPLNTTIFYLIGFFTIYGALAILVLTVVSLGPLPGPSDQALAARLGLILLVLACSLGYWILQYGVQRAHEGLAPETYGEHGVMKFPHGLPLHSIQYLALQGWLMRYTRISEQWRVRLIAASAAGLFLVTVFGLMQTLAGHARFDLTHASEIVLIVSIVLFSLPIVASGLISARRSNLWSGRQTD